MPSGFDSRADLDKRIAKAMDSAIELADLGNRMIPAQTIAERVYDTESRLMDELKRPWLIERMTWMVSRRRRERRIELRPEQMLLDDPIFKGLPKRIFLRDGRRALLERASLTENREHLTMLRERLRSHSRVRQFEAVVELHEKWARVRRGITWEEVVQMEAEERESS